MINLLGSIVQNPLDGLFELFRKMRNDHLGLHFLERRNSTHQTVIFRIGYQQNQV